MRSKTPELVMQEFYALLMAHAAIRRLTSEAAIRTDRASEDLSFVHTVTVLKRRLPRAGGPSPQSDTEAGLIAYWPKSLPSRA